VVERSDPRIRETARRRAVEGRQGSRVVPMARRRRCIVAVPPHSLAHALAALALAAVALVPGRAAALMVCDPEKGVVEIDARHEDLPRPAVPPNVTSAAMTAEEVTHLLAQIQRCYSPRAVPGHVQVRIAFAPDGTVAGTPYILNPSSEASFRMLAKSACLAILRCQPYALPPGKYDRWNEVSVHFEEVR